MSSIDDLSDFAPRKPKLDRSLLDREEKWPSRAPEPVPEPDAKPVLDWQVSIRGPRPMLEEFKRLCRRERREYWDMLRILMDEYDKNHK
jgi:uncharacterized Zn finger protein